MINLDHIGGYEGYHHEEGGEVLHMRKKERSPYALKGIRGNKGEKGKRVHLLPLQ